MRRNARRDYLIKIAKQNADQRVSTFKNCECDNFDHEHHWGHYCTETLGIAKHYSYSRSSKVIRICNKCATQIRSSQSRILGRPY